MGRFSNNEQKDQKQRPFDTTRKPTVVPSSLVLYENRETDIRRLKARQQQIDYGKNTLGYQHYIKQIPKAMRKPQDPKTPDKYQKCSKRSWDGQVSKWRRRLHEWDPKSETKPHTDEGITGEDNDNTQVEIVIDEEEEEIEIM